MPVLLNKARVFFMLDIPDQYWVYLANQTINPVIRQSSQILFRNSLMRY